MVKLRIWIVCVNSPVKGFFRSFEYVQSLLFTGTVLLFMLLGHEELQKQSCPLLPGH